MIAGLRRGDAPSADIWRLVRTTISAIERTVDDEDDALAAGLVTRCHERGDVLSAAQRAALDDALGEAAERALLRHLDAADLAAEDDFEELAAAEKAEAEDEGWSCEGEDGCDKLLCMPACPKQQVISSEDSEWLSRRFLAVMSEHHGWI